MTNRRVSTVPSVLVFCLVKLLHEHSLSIHDLIRGSSEGNENRVASRNGRPVLKAHGLIVRVLDAICHCGVVHRGPIRFSQILSCFLITFRLFTDRLEFGGAPWARREGGGTARFTGWPQPHP